MGNPHAIFWVDDVEAYDLARFGPLLENHPIFPERANISLAHVTARDAITVKTWERGVGLTRACGTAACAAAVAAMRKKLADQQGDGDAARRPARRRMARRRPRLDDRPGRDRVRGHARPGDARLVAPRRARRDAGRRAARQPPPRGGVSRRASERCDRHPPESLRSTSPQGTASDDARRPHLRLPAERARIRGDAARAAEAGLADAILVNTCAVTAEAVRQARQAIRRARREHPEARIVVTGCAAQIDPESFAAMPEVDLVLGNDEKLARGELRVRLRHRRDRAGSASTTSCRCARPPATSIEGIDGRARAFVEVQNGCDHRCTFCIIPYGRGNSRSVPMGAVVEQIRRLVANGYREVVLTGVDITAYGADLPGHARASAGSSARSSATCRSSQRLRLSSIDSIEVDDALLRGDRRGGAADAASPSVAAVGRRHDPEAHEAPPLARRRASASPTTVRRLRPDVVFGADLIAGFPTETEAMFANSLVDRRRLRPHPPPRLPLLAAAGHAGRAHAAARPRRWSRSAPRGCARRATRRYAAHLAARARRRRAASWSSATASAAPSISRSPRSPAARPATSSRRGSPATPPARSRCAARRPDGRSQGTSSPRPRRQASAPAAEDGGGRRARRRRRAAPGSQRLKGGLVALLERADRGHQRRSSPSASSTPRRSTSSRTC